MPVETVHEDFRASEYEVMRTSHEGQHAIKLVGAEYLPMPSGYAAIEDQTVREAAYNAFRIRATYTSLIAAAVEGLSGMAHRAPWQIELPDRLSYLMDEVSPNMGMAEYTEMMVREVLLMGRMGNVVEAVGNKPYLMPYCAETITNWRLNGKNLDQVILKEITNAETSDRFVRSKVTNYRVLEMIEGRYVQSEWRESSSGAKDHEETTLNANYQYGHLPFTLASSQSTDISRRDAIPMQPMADNLLAAYRKSGDLEQAEHMAASPTAYAFGIAKEYWPTMLGPAVIVCSEDKDAKLGYAETSGNGIEGMRKTHENLISSALMHSHHLAERGQQVESGEALGVRVSTRTASLASVVRNAGYALTGSLRHAARWIGAREEEVRVEPNMDFVQNTVDPNVMKEMSQQVALNLIPPEVYFDYLRDTGVTEKDNDELSEGIDTYREKVEAASVGLDKAFEESDEAA